MILTESSDSTDYIMGAQTGLFDCLKDGEVGGLLKSLIVSPEREVEVMGGVRKKGGERDS